MYVLSWLKYVTDDSYFIDVRLIRRRINAQEDAINRRVATMLAMNHTGKVNENCCLRIGCYRRVLRKSCTSHHIILVSIIN